MTATICRTYIPDFSPNTHIKKRCVHNTYRYTALAQPPFNPAYNIGISERIEPNPASSRIGVSSVVSSGMAAVIAARLDTVSELEERK